MVMSERLARHVSWIALLVMWKNLCFTLNPMKPLEAFKQ